MKKYTCIYGFKDSTEYIEFNNDKYTIVLTNGKRIDVNSKLFILCVLHNIQKGIYVEYKEEEMSLSE